MTQRCIIAGNWKMNGMRRHVQELAQAVVAAANQHKHDGLEVVICPPAPLLSAVADLCENTVSVGGQDCHSAESGAHTGDLSAEMLADAGARYVLVGHSERRDAHRETNEDVCAKAKAALRAGLTPIICIGESLSQREGGQTQMVLEGQIKGSIPSNANSGNCVVAYEPVWAIGTGKVATPEMVEETHRWIADALPAGMAILYGGSVKADNAAELLALPSVSGVLVGGASLQSDGFAAIIAAGAQSLAVDAAVQKAS